MEIVQQIIDALGLVPHPEGGHYVETWRDRVSEGARGTGSAIYYLLRAGEVSMWHRIDAAELWHFYTGGPLELRIFADGTGIERHVLGTDILRQERPQVVVPAGAWQSARSLGDWTLVGCTVSPAFEFETFELAPAGWTPGASKPGAGSA
jgi:predicted cupin superfamily sugar epimerase